MKKIKSKISYIRLLTPILLVLFGSVIFISAATEANNTKLCSASQQSCINSVRLVDNTSPYCGDPAQAVYTSINFGCSHKGNPITDLLFAIIRFLSAGVGIIVIGSIVVGGMQYIGSRGEPQATGQAINRIRSSIIALIIYIFGFAILNYLIPVGFFHQ